MLQVIWKIQNVLVDNKLSKTLEYDKEDKIVISLPIFPLWHNIGMVLTKIHQGSTA